MKETHVMPKFSKSSNAAITSCPLSPIIQQCLKIRESHIRNYGYFKLLKLISMFLLVRCIYFTWIKQIIVCKHTSYNDKCEHADSVYNTLVKVFVIRDWMLLVVVLNVLQLWAISRAAKSRKAQWLSTSGLKHNCLLTIHVTTAGINSWSWMRAENKGNFY